MSGQEREDAQIHTADDGYCVAECPHGLGSDFCGLQVVRPGKFQCWCDGVSDTAMANLTAHIGSDGRQS